jgi:hypothetical protein
MFAGIATLISRQTSAALGDARQTMDDGPHQLVAVKPGEVRPTGAERGEAMDRRPDREGVVIGVSACRPAGLFAEGNAVDERLQGSG